jgi:hypothetical protein
MIGHEGASLEGVSHGMHSDNHHPGVQDLTIDAHVHRAQISLGEALAQRRVVSLDTKFWILLRDAAANGTTTPATELLVLLREGMDGGRLFCPISESVFVELMKQSDPTTRIANEVAHFMRATTGRPNVHPPKHLAWRKLSYVLGILHPTMAGVGPARELAIQKAFFDHMWSMPLQEMLALTGIARFGRAARRAGFARCRGLRGDDLN